MTGMTACWRWSWSSCRERGGLEGGREGGRLDGAASTSSPTPAPFLCRPRQPPHTPAIPPVPPPLPLQPLVTVWQAWRERGLGSPGQGAASLSMTCLLLRCTPGFRHTGLSSFVAGPSHPVPARTPRKAGPTPLPVDYAGRAASRRLHLTQPRPTNAHAAGPDQNPNPPAAACAPSGLPPHCKHSRVHLSAALLPGERGYRGCMPPTPRIPPPRRVHRISGPGGRPAALQRLLPCKCLWVRWG